MLDIVEIKDGHDLVIADSVTPKAGNVLSIQIGDLAYAPAFGLDFKFFLDSDLQFQNESFKAYIVQRLIESQVNVSQVISIVNTLSQTFTFETGNISDKNSEGLIL